MRARPALAVRAAAAAVALAALAVPLVADRDRATPVVAQGDVGSLTPAPMPVLRPAAELGATWFCPGVAAGADGPSGVIVLANAGDQPTRVTLTVTPSEGTAVSQNLDVGARARVEVDVSQVAKARFAAAQVETTSGNLVVEQRSAAKLDDTYVGQAVSPCATAPSQTWYLADGATTTDAEDTLLVYNPFPDQATVSMVFADDNGVRRPPSFQRKPVPPRSLAVVTIDSVVQRKQQVSVEVTADKGRVVVGRQQLYKTKPRRTLVAGLAAPSAGTQWIFADVEVKAGEAVGSAATSFAVYNPNDTSADVTVRLLPAAGNPEAALEPTTTAAPDDGSTTTAAATADPADPAGDPATGAPATFGVPVSVTVPAGGSVLVNADASNSVPDGFYSALVVSGAGQPVVVERLLRRTGDPRVVTTVQLGSRLLSKSWQFAASPPAGWSSVLVVANPSPVPATVTAETLGPAGLVAVAGLTDVVVPPGGVLRFDLDALGAGSAPVVLRADVELVAERLLSAPVDQPGATITYGIPSTG